MRRALLEIAVGWDVGSEVFETSTWPVTHLIAGTVIAGVISGAGAFTKSGTGILTLTGTKSLDRAISTAGGIPFDEVDEQLMLRRMPDIFVAGEMLDWEAPTGGYLLQATFATGIAAARGVLARLGIPDAALTGGLSSATGQT